MRRRPQLTFVIVPVVVYLAVLFLLALLVVKPPPLGWLGFAVAGTVGLAVATFAALLFRRAGVNADPAPKAHDGVHRLLLLADADPFVELSEELRSHLRRGPTRVRVVSPVLASPLHFITEDERSEVIAARGRLYQVEAVLARGGIAADGAVGTDNPLQAIGDALVSFPADEIVVVTSDAGQEMWLERGLRAQARQLFRIPVTCIRANSAFAGRP